MEYLLLVALLFAFLYLIFVASSFATSFLWNRVLLPLGRFLFRRLSTLPMASLNVKY